jgi:3-phosphoglycerate kinase
VKSIRDVEVKDKKIFLRVDFNVPMKDGTVVSANRLTAAVPTIEYLIERGAKIIIGTHLGRPEGKYDPAFSTVPVAEELSKILNKPVSGTDHVVSSLIEEKIARMKQGEIILLGNMRFHPEEEENNKEFAKKIASYVDLYVNDAFAVSHRANASVDAITQFLPSYSGLLLESEITTLNLFLTSPEHPFVVVVGGAKVKDKAGVLEKLAEKADNILLGGAVGNTFLAAKGQNVSKSLVESEMLPKCKEIMDILKEKIMLPSDSINEDLGNGEFRSLDIGHATIANFVREINDAKCIFWNGNLGYTEDVRYCAGTLAIAKAMSDNLNVKVAAGGDTVGFIEQNGLRGGFSFISTGGSATMEFLAGVSLPGIAALEREN